MGKKLSEMTLEELWHLFPITLSTPNEQWSVYYDEMKKLIETILSEYTNFKINHIGSTSIKGIWAKPIIDILVEFDKKENLNNIADLFEHNGFIAMSRSESKISLNMGYTEQGFADKVYHLHLRHIGDNDELYFRDYLNEFHDVAQSYEKLKLDLWQKYKFNRDGYTDAKADFVRKYTLKAKERYYDRYN